MSPSQQERQARIKYWLIGAIAVAIGGWLVWRSQVTSQTESTAERPASENIETPNPSADELANATPSAALPTVPVGAKSATADLNLGVEPGSVGWTSEAFNESSLVQLKKFAKLISRPESIDEPEVARLLSDDFRCNSLRPSGLKLVHDGGVAKVRQWSGSSDEPLSKGLTDLAEIAGELPRLSSDEHHVGVKNVRVILGDIVSTEVRASGIGTRSDKSTEWTATWQCEWDTSNSTNPRIRSLRVVEYEEVSTAHAKPFLIDRTFEVMSQADGYSDQLLVGMNSWVNRLERRLRVNRLGHNGIAVGDVNGDGRDDVYVCQSGGLPNRLYVQQDDGTVKDVSKIAGVDFLDDTTCALLVDLDNDGDQDLALVTVVAAVVLSNDGTGKFTPQATIADCRNSFSLTAVDINQDRLLDLYVGRYWASDAARGEHPLPIPYYDANNGGKNVLLQNRGNWKFDDVTEAVGLNKNNSRFTMAAAWEDLDSDGDADLYVANDFGRNCWYRNDQGQFNDFASDANVEDIASGMSVSFGDFNHDGQFDIYVSNMFSTAGQRTTTQNQYKKSFDSTDLSKLQRLARGNTLFRKSHDQTFTDVSLDANVNMGRWAWGSMFVDVDNDSWDDLMVANGFLTTSDTGDM